jgi:hypothetical protein
MPLINHERAAQPARIQLIGAQQVYEINLAGLSVVENSANVPAAGRRHEAEIESADPRRRCVQHVEAVP